MRNKLSCNNKLRYLTHFTGKLKGLFHPAFLARVVSWLAFVVAKQRPAKRRHVQGMLDETEPLKSYLKGKHSGDILRTKLCMQTIKNKFKGNFENITCRACGLGPESYEHIIKHHTKKSIIDHILIIMRGLLNTKKKF